MKTVIVIPARYGSSRFPGKLLTPIGGIPLIRRVWEQARACRLAERVVVATDDDRIRSEVEGAGGEAVMTDSTFRTGTDRLAWVAERIPAEAYLNLQGDELIREPGMLDELIASFAKSQPLEMGTLKKKAEAAGEAADPNVVKVVTDLEGNALYFSRAAVPFRRDGTVAPGEGPAAVYKHLGIYIYRKDVLIRLSRLPSGELEEFEKLEQLRALENGIRIRVWETRHESLRIDTPRDAEAAARALGRGRVG